MNNKSKVRNKVSQLIENELVKLGHCLNKNQDEYQRLIHQPSSKNRKTQELMLKFNEFHLFERIQWMEKVATLQAQEASKTLISYQNVLQIIEQSNEKFPLLSFSIQSGIDEQ